jgi:hypothetical protein
MNTIMGSIRQVLADAWVERLRYGYCPRCGVWGMQEEVWGCHRCRGEAAAR